MPAEFQHDDERCQSRWVCGSSWRHESETSQFHFSSCVNVSHLFGKRQRFCYLKVWELLQVPIQVQQRWVHQFVMEVFPQCITILQKHNSCHHRSYSTFTWPHPCRWWGHSNRQPDTCLCHLTFPMVMTSSFPCQSGSYTSCRDWVRLMEACCIPAGPETKSAAWWCHGGGENPKYTNLENNLYAKWIIVIRRSDLIGPNYLCIKRKKQFDSWQLDTVHRWRKNMLCVYYVWCFIWQRAQHL